MARGLKIAKYGNTDQTNIGDIDQATHPQQVTFADSTSSTVTSYVGGVGGTPTGTTSLTIQVHFKTAAGVLKNDGFIVRQRGRKQFDVQSVSGGVATLTRCTLVESGTLAAKQMYITFGQNGSGVQYASRISNRYVWTASNTARFAYTLGLSAAVSYIQTTPGVVFYNSDSSVSKVSAVVEGA
jgi:hypothetical protein